MLSISIFVSADGLIDADSPKKVKLNDAKKETQRIKVSDHRKSAIELSQAADNEVFELLASSEQTISDKHAEFALANFKQDPNDETV